MATNYFNGKTDLGNTPEMFAAYAHFGTLSPGLEYDALHGSLHSVLAEDSQLPQEYLSKLASQCAAFLKEFGPKLSDHEKWILSQLRSAAADE